MNNYIKFETKRDMDCISVTWNIATVCNYDCSYCMTMSKDGLIKFNDNYQAFITLLKRIKAKNPDKKISLLLSGGEITIWKKLPLLLKECKDLGEVYITLISNGSSSIDWWNKNIHFLDYIVLSYHSEYANVDHFSKVAKIVTDNNKYGQVSLMVKGDDFDETIKKGKHIHEYSGLTVIPKFLRVNFTDTLFTYTDEQIKYFKSEPRFGKNTTYPFLKLKITATREDGTTHTFDTIREIFWEKENRYKGWKCWSGIEQFHVWGEHLSTCQGGGDWLGSIYGDYELPDEPCICKKDMCKSIQDLWDCKKMKY